MYHCYAPGHILIKSTARNFSAVNVAHFASKFAVCTTHNHWSMAIWHSANWLFPFFFRYSTHWHSIHFCAQFSRRVRLRIRTHNSINRSQRENARIDVMCIWLLWTYLDDLNKYLIFLWRNFVHHHHWLRWMRPRECVPRITNIEIRRHYSREKKVRQQQAVSMSNKFIC